MRDKRAEAMPEAFTPGQCKVHKTVPANINLKREAPKPKAVYSFMEPV